MSENATKYCSNCCQNIEAAKFFLHERMCSINVKKCPKCNKPFTIEDLEDHMKEVHTDVECEFCKKKYPKIEIEKHKARCDSKLVQCTYCELAVLLGEIKEHQKHCGAITEPCPNCGRYVQRKDKDNHLIEGCPPPKNDRRSVDVVRNNNNNKYLLDMNQNNNIINNYNPINFIPEDILGQNYMGKEDIKIHNNMNKPNLAIRPASGKKLLNENLKKNMSNLGGSKRNNEQNKINNMINSKNSSKTGKAAVINNLNNYNKNNNNNKKDNNNYMNKHNNNNKGPISLKPMGNNNNNKKKDPNSSRYNELNNNNNNNNKNIGKINAKPSFATNLSKGNLNLNSSRDSKKKSDEEFRRTRDKLNFKEAKKIEQMNLNKEVQNLSKNNIKKSIIDDDDYIANFNFGEVDDDQLLQQVIEQSLKEQNHKK